MTDQELIISVLLQKLFYKNQVHSEIAENYEHIGTNG